ncbi:ABC transporter substrate-binding protein [Roseibium aggregatum]|uniref:ABC transporter substrate-binding protein n=1 Tax=Roseibium aggregatum TaxID=187304 RepID=A0A926S8S5_9HYPH|nr:ABC transporter substrate-binding protein [Roseibium aggregatum]MBD1545424.1 ABC transporter substrate-binding protein [Roseibium aggregatum]
MRIVRICLLFAVAFLQAEMLRAQEMTHLFGPEDAPRRLVIRSTTDTDVFAGVVEAFLAERPGVSVLYEQWGSNDLYGLTSKDCRSGEVGADVVISSGVHQMVKLVNDACAAKYQSALTRALPQALRWRDEVWGITREPAVIVYNRSGVPPADVPRTRFDLLDLLRPEDSPYAGKVATYDIEASGLGYLFAFMDSQEASTFGALLESLGRTGADATCCSAEIIEGVATGKYLLAYNVLGSYAEGLAREDDRIGIVLPQDYTLVLSRALMIPKQAGNMSDARAFLDFLLSQQGRTELRQALLIAPGLDGDSADAGEGISETALRPIGLSPSLLVALDRQKRDQFIRLWRGAFPGP